MATSHHVLVVDDTLVGRLVATGILNYYNIRVTPVESSEQALMVLDEENDVDLVLTNYDMFDGMSGYELLREVKESSNLKHIPVVIVFIDESSEVVEMCMDAGADGYIFKPIRFFHVPLIMSLI